MTDGNAQLRSLAEAAHFNGHRGPRLIDRTEDELTLKRLRDVHDHLLKVAANYVIGGRSDYRAERLRRASDASGIPAKLIDVAAQKMERGNG